MTFARKVGATITECGTWRYDLDREVQPNGIVFGFCGVNCSYAGPIEEDHTTMKWRGFTLRNAGRWYIAFNPFAYRSTKVGALATAADPVGPLNAQYVRQAIADSDVLVPCWGNSSKVPKHLRHHFADMLALMRASGKPIKTFGFTQSGDPMHPLMLGYDTPLTEWRTP